MTSVVAAIAIAFAGVRRSDAVALFSDPALRRAETNLFLDPRKRARMKLFLDPRQRARMKL